MINRTSAPPPRVSAGETPRSAMTKQGIRGCPSVRYTRRPFQRKRQECGRRQTGWRRAAPSALCRRCLRVYRRQTGNWDTQTAILAWRAKFSIARPSTRQGRIGCRPGFRACARTLLGVGRLATFFFGDSRLPDRKQLELSLSLLGRFPRRSTARRTLYFMWRQPQEIPFK